MNCGYFYAPYITLDGEDEPVLRVETEVIEARTRRLSGEWRAFIAPAHAEPDPPVLIKLVEKLLGWD